jgi:hypothetical protein
MSTFNPFSDSTKLSGPITRWLTLLLGAAIAGGSWFMLKAEVSQHSKDIEGLRIDVQDLQRSRQADREVLIRIDENVKALKERTR